jgi:hypothetical protein
MRGWWKATDGRLYHPEITKIVMAVLATRAGWRKRHSAEFTCDPPREHRDTTVVAPGVVVGVDVGVEVGKPLGTVSENAVCGGELTLTAPTPLEPKPKRATRLPEDWRLPAEWKQWAVDGHHLNPEAVVKASLRFRDHFLGAPGRHGTKTNWLATWPALIAPSAATR